MKYINDFFIITFFLSIVVNAQVNNHSWQYITQKPGGAWFATPEAREIAENVLLYQRDIGGWPKNIQMQVPLSESQKKELLKLKQSTKEVTTDNGATVQEMIYLSKMYRQISDVRYKKAFLKGVDYLLEAQYENGGWPQFYPLKKGYYTHITYNDNSIYNILTLFKDLKDNTGVFSIQPSPEIIAKLKMAFEKGIACILKTQYKQNGVLTSWCAQHDERTLAPAKARAYELPSLSGQESANLVLLLMSVKNPDEKIKNAINSAVQWFKEVKISGIRVKRLYDEDGQIINKTVIEEEDSPPIWARFMDLEDNTPFFCDRDGIKKRALSDIGAERRNGYRWYTYEPQKVLDAYSKWTSENNRSANQTKKISPYQMTVAKDGSGDFTSIQAAINNAKSFPYQQVIIKIKKGIYKEKVHVYSWNTKISLLGEDKMNTIITFDDYFDKINLGRNSTFHTPTVLVEGNDFIAKNLTIKNSSGEVGQAIALSVHATRCFFENCTILGYQDTLYVSGEGYKQYFKNCYIAGSTDFIFGEATAFFENCEIHSKANSFITAASTPEDQEFGLVFKNCALTADADVTRVYLGRPWRTYAKTVFINCQLGDHIRPEGWNNWSNPEAEKKGFYGEYENKGPGNQPKKRVSWSYQLKTSQVKKYKVNNILKSKINEKNKYWFYNEK